uniref:Uncharacterized protein n=1 Tax=Oryza glumipatula TaxID=40148 RepID=A0A0E0BHC6_9ORYZ
MIRCQRLDPVVCPSPSRANPPSAARGGVWVRRPLSPPTRIPSSLRPLSRGSATGGDGRGGSGDLHHLSAPCLCRSAAGDDGKGGSGSLRTTSQNFKRKQGLLRVEFNDNLESTLIGGGLTAEEPFV